MPSFRPALIACVSALAVAATAPAAFAQDAGHSRPARPTVIAKTSAALTDLQPASADALDGAKGTVTVVAHRKQSSFRLRLAGADTSAAGTRFVAQLYTGACVAGDPAAAGAVYNTDVLAGAAEPRSSKKTELRMGFVINGRGAANAVRRVPFVPTAGERSLVISTFATDAAASTPVACLPITLK